MAPVPVRKVTGPCFIRGESLYSKQVHLTMSASGPMLGVDRLGSPGPPTTSTLVRKTATGDMCGHGSNSLITDSASSGSVERRGCSRDRQMLLELSKAYRKGYKYLNKLKALVERSARAIKRKHFHVEEKKKRKSDMVAAERRTIRKSDEEVYTPRESRPVSAEHSNDGKRVAEVDGLKHTDFKAVINSIIPEEASELNGAMPEAKPARQLFVGPVMRVEPVPAQPLQPRTPTAPAPSGGTFATTETVRPSILPISTTAGANVHFRSAQSSNPVPNKQLVYPEQQSKPPSPGRQMSSEVVHSVFESENIETLGKQDLPGVLANMDGVGGVARALLSRISASVYCPRNSQPPQSRTVHAAQQNLTLLQGQQHLHQLPQTRILQRSQHSIKVVQRGQPQHQSLVTTRLANGSYTLMSTGRSHGLPNGLHPGRCNVTVANERQ